MRALADEHGQALRHLPPGGEQVQVPAVQSTPRKRKRESAGGEGGGRAPASGPGETEEDPICLD